MFNTPRLIRLHSKSSDSRRKLSLCRWDHVDSEQKKKTKKGTKNRSKMWNLAAVVRDCDYKRRRMSDKCIRCNIGTLQSCAGAFIISKVGREFFPCAKEIAINKNAFALHKIILMAHNN